MSELLTDCHQALEHGDTEFAGALLLEHCHSSPDDPEGWVMLCRFLIDGGKAPFAYPIAKQAALAHRSWKTMMMLGATEASLQMAKQATKTLKRALAMMPKDESPENLAIVYRLMANACVQGYQFKQAEHYAQKSLAIESHHQAHTAYAFSKLHQREWQEGWQHYVHQLGHAEFRKKHDYGLPEWQGEPDAKLIVYGEQGLGDQIAFMSACPITPSQINCNPKLESLFKRTFPRSEVYGMQFEKEFTPEIKATHQTSMATMMQWSDMKRRGAYLLVSDEKKLMYRGLIDSLSDKPKIGIAWTGGMVGSDGWRTRKLDLQQLSPLLHEDYTFVSLQYKDFKDDIESFKWETGIKIHDFPWGSMSSDYEDTAALVEALDAIVCVPTTAYHLAGALGKPAYVLVHEQPHWHEGLEGECPWWESVEFYRRKELGTEKAIQAVITRLKAKFYALQGAA